MKRNIKTTEKCGVASIGRAVTTLFLKSVCYTYILISLQPTMSVTLPLQVELHLPMFTPKHRIWDNSFKIINLI